MKTKLIILLLLISTRSFGQVVDLRPFAKLASPTFTGTPKSTTPTWFDASKNIATTEYVDRITKLSIYPGNTLDSFGDSFTAGSLESATTKRYVNVINTSLGTTISNQGVGGDGVFNCFKKVVSTRAVNNVYATTLMIGFNDANRSVTDAGLYTIKSGHKAILAALWSKTAVAANNAAVTTSGTWTTTSGTAYNDRASYGLSGLVRTSSVAGSTLTWSFSGNNLIIGTWGCDVTNVDAGRFTVTIDGTVVETYDPANKGKYIATGQELGRNHDALIYLNLDGGTHTVVITTLDNKPTPIDYFGTLVPPNQAYPVLVGSIPKRDPTKYRYGGSDAKFDDADTQIKAAIASFPGYPVTLVNTNKYWIPTIGQDISTVDSLHPTDKGAGHLAAAFIESVKQENSFGLTLSGDKGDSNPNVLTISNTNTTGASAFASLLMYSSSPTAASYIRAHNSSGVYGQIINYGASRAGLTGVLANKPVSISTNGTEVIYGAFNATAGANAQIAVGDWGNVASIKQKITSVGTYMGNGTATAVLHLPAGTATASTAPLKFTSGTNLTTPEAGAVEFNGTNLFITASTTRYTIAKLLTNSATLDFPSTAAGASSDLTITVTGAADFDPVTVAPAAAVTTNGIFVAFVSNSNTVTVRFYNNTASAVDPTAATYKVSVQKF